MAMLTSRCVLIALTVCIGHWRTTLSIQCLPPRWFEKRETRSNSLAPVSQRDLVKDKKVCSMRCLAMSKCVTLDLVKAENKQWHCLLYEHYVSTTADHDSSHWIFTVPCRARKSAPYTYFAYMGKYTIGGRGSAVTSKVARSLQDCVKHCFVDAKCHTVSYSAHGCLLVSGQHILNPWKRLRNDSFMFSRNWPIKLAVYGKKLALNRSRSVQKAEPSQAARLQPALTPIMKAMTRECTYQYIGQYDITDSEQVTAISATSIRACLEKCTETSSCQVVSYSNGVCLLSANEGQEADGRWRKQDISQYRKQTCSMRTVAPTWRLLSVLEVVFVVLSFQVLI